MIHIPVVLVINAAQVAYRHRALIADSIRAIEAKPRRIPPAARTENGHSDLPEAWPTDASLHSENIAAGQLEADARAEHSAHMHAMAAGMKAWATMPRTW